MLASVELSAGLWYTNRIGIKHAMGITHSMWNTNRMLARRDSSSRREGNVCEVELKMFDVFPLVAKSRISIIADIIKIWHSYRFCVSLEKTRGTMSKPVKHISSIWPTEISIALGLIRSTLYDEDEVQAIINAQAIIMW